MWTIIWRGALLSLVFVAACDAFTGEMPSWLSTVAFTIAGGWLLEVLLPRKSKSKLITDLLTLSDKEIGVIASGKRSSSS
jgi:hypothetical protein